MTTQESVKLTDMYIQNKIEKLTEDEKEIFNNMFKKYNRSYGMAIFFAFLSLHYLYINTSSIKNWILQGLYIGTAGGCGLWLLVDIIRMKNILGKNYTKKAETILSKIK